MSGKQIIKILIHSILMFVLLQHTVFNSSLVQITQWNLHAENYELSIRKLGGESLITKDPKKIQQFLDFINNYKYQRSYKREFILRASSQTYDINITSLSGHQYFGVYIIDEKYIQFMSNNFNFNKVYKVTSPLDTQFLGDFYKSIENGTIQNDGDTRI